MATYLITYDLHDKQYEKALLDYVRVGEWKQVAESSYVVIRSKSADDIVTAIRKVTKSESSDKDVKSNVTVFVVTVRKPWAAFATKDLLEWLATHLPEN
jgi:hypothetical protein